MRSDLWRLSWCTTKRLGKKADRVGALDKLAEKRRKPKVAGKTYISVEKDGKMLFVRGNEQLVGWSKDACEKRLVKLLEEANGNFKAPSVVAFWDKLYQMNDSADDMKRAHAAYCILMCELVWDKLATPPPVVEPDIFSAPELVHDLAEDIFGGFGV